MPNTRKLNSSLQKVREFIQLLVNDLLNTPTSYVFKHFSTSNEFRLDLEKYALYSECIDCLIEACDDDEVSQKSIEDSFNDAIIKCLKDIDSEEPIEHYIALHIDSLRKTLERPLLSHQVILPITGLNKNGLPFTFGKIDFFVFEESHFQEYFHIEEEDKSWFIDKVFAKVSVFSKDQIAARNQAIRTLRVRIDILNFFSYFVPFQTNGFSFLSTEGQYRKVLQSIVCDPGSHSISFEQYGSISGTTISRLIETDFADAIGFEYICTLLNSENLNKFQKNLITAIQWAGKAISTERREESFVLFAISLESIMLEASAKPEMSYRMANRIAILYNSKDYDFHKKIKSIYTIRSKIVHNGSYEVYPQDLDLLRTVTTRCLRILCTNSHFQQYSRSEQFFEYLDRKLYESSASSD